MMRCKSTLNSKHMETKILLCKEYDARTIKSGVAPSFFDMTVSSHRRSSIMKQVDSLSRTKN